MPPKQPRRHWEDPDNIEEFDDSRGWYNPMMDTFVNLKETEWTAFDWFFGKQPTANYARGHAVLFGSNFCLAGGTIVGGLYWAVRRPPTVTVQKCMGNFGIFGAGMGLLAGVASLALQPGPAALCPVRRLLYNQTRVTVYEDVQREDFSSEREYVLYNQGILLKQNFHVRCLENGPMLGVCSAAVFMYAESGPFWMGLTPGIKGAAQAITLGISFNLFSTMMVAWYLERVTENWKKGNTSMWPF